MGIKFFCPNGHKLNVKAFLSGKRAICPKCGAKVLVPTESQIGQRASVGTGAPPGYQDDGLAQGSAPSQPFPSAAPPLNPVAVAEYFGDRGIPGIDLGDDASDGALSTRRAGETAPGGHPAIPMSDPIDTVRSAIWYVRTPNGEQFGPLTEDVIRGRVKDGQISADALVWRAGWQQWNSAGATFLFRPVVPPPLHGIAPAQPLPPTIQITVAEAPVVEDGPGTLLYRSRQRRRKQQHLALLVSVALLVATIILVFVLVAVLSSQKDGPKEETKALSFRPAAIQTDLKIAAHP